MTDDRKGTFWKEIRMSKREKIKMKRGAVEEHDWGCERSKVTL